MDTRRVARLSPGLTQPASGGMAWLVAALLLTATSGRVAAQVHQQWSHSAPRGDASGAVAMGDSLMFVNNNEDAVLRLYSRYPSSACQAALYSLDVQANLGLTGSDLTVDLESAVKVVGAGGARIYWLGSLGNSAGGNHRPNRDRVFATQVLGDGTGTPPFTLAYVGRYDHLRDDILAWDANNLHGLGAHYFGLEASAAVGVSPKAVNGFNVEGLAMAPDGTTAWIGCRTPLVNGSGPTTMLSPRTHALIIPVSNLEALVTGNPTAGPGAAQFGSPMVLPLGSRGIRSLDATFTGEYIVTAGPADVVSNPPAAPLDFRVFSWSGHPLGSPVELSTTFSASYSPEACIPPNGPIGAASTALFIHDDGGSSCWRSTTCPIGAAAGSLDAPEPSRPSSGVRFSRPPAPSPGRGEVSFAIELARPQSVELSILDVKGRNVATIWRGELPNGEHMFRWNGLTRTRDRPPAGVYWIRLGAGGTFEARSLTVLQ